MNAIDFLVHLELHDGEIKKSSLEAFAEARRQAAAAQGKVSAVLLGAGATDKATELAGAEKVFVSDDAFHATFHLEGQTDCLLHAVEVTGAQVVLLAASPIGRELAPAVAASLDTAVAADVTALNVAGDSVEVMRPVYAGKAILTARYRRLPAVITLRPNVFSATSDAAGSAPPEVVAFDPVDASRYAASVVDTLALEHKTVDHTEASIIVSGGRGLKRPEDDDEAVKANFALLESLAAKLGGVVGASRAVCDVGWRPHSDQIGQTGKTVAPKLYIACGISGAIQHLAGMSSSGCIVAINSNPDAPIFKVADYGVVGDLFEVVPALERALD